MRGVGAVVDTARRGGITKAGNRHARRLLIEAAWHYRHRPNAANLKRRREGQPPHVVALADKAMLRLHRRFSRMLEKGKPRPKIVVAVARELAGFVWAALHPTRLSATANHTSLRAAQLWGSQSTDEDRHDPEDTRRSFATGRLSLPDSRHKTALPLDGERSCGSALRATRAYENDSSSKRPAASVVCGPQGGDRGLTTRDGACHGSFHMSCEAPKLTTLRQLQLLVRRRGPSYALTMLYWYLYSRANG